MIQLMTQVVTYLGFCVYVATISCNALISLFPEISNNKCHKSGYFCSFSLAPAPNGGLSNPNSANTCWWISHKGCMLICFAWYCIMYMSDVRQVRPVWWHWITVQSGQSRRSGRVWPGKNWESLWKGGHGTLRTVKGGHWGVRGTPNRRDMSADTWLWGHQTKETCQAGTLDTVFQGFEKTAKKPWCFHSGLHVSLWDQQCGRQRATCRELYFYTIKKCKCKCIAQNFSTNQQPLSILKLVSGVHLTLCSISEWRRKFGKMGWDVW